MSNNTSAVATQQQNRPTPQILGININSLSEAITLAEFFAKSDLVPRDYQNKPGNIVVAWQKGWELGISPSQSLEAIAVINGRACLWGDTVLALVRSSGLLESLTEEVSDTEAVVTAKRKGEPTPIVRRFSMADATKAGLVGKSGPWTTYPKRMLQMRARAFALRDGFADILKGMSIAEEIQDIEAQPTTVSTVVDVKQISGGLMEKVAAAKAVSAPVVDVAPEPKHQFKDLAELSITLNELGLEITTKTHGEKTYALISSGNIDGLEETLAGYGFTKGKKEWGMEVTDLVAAEAGTL